MQTQSSSSYTDKVSAMSSRFGGIVKNNGVAWTWEEKDVVFKIFQKAEKKIIAKQKATGMVIEKISVPLPDYNSLVKYKKDNKLRAQLSPYHTNNPLKLKKPLFD